jgi:tripartite-type tricarboxylate transporter receptor subunit TctC
MNEKRRETMKRQVLSLRIQCLFLGLLLVAPFISPSKLQAAPYYEGKVMKIIVGVSPGGGFDIVARVLAKHLPKYIPGKPTIIVENMVGASTMIAANHVYNIAKPDGLTIATVFRSLLVAQLMKVQGMRFDLTKFSWVGGSGPEAYLFTIRGDLPYKTYEELIKSKNQVVLGATGATDATFVFPTLLKVYTGLNIKIAIYPASPEVMLAIERKEVDGRAGSFNSLKPFIDRGLVRPLLRGRVSQRGAENLPVDEKFASDKMGASIMAMYSAGNLIGRPYVAPPGTPPEIMNILRKAFAEVGKDPEFMSDVEKNKTDFDYVSAEECLKVVNFTINQPEDIVREFGKYVKF